MSTAALRETNTRPSWILVFDQDDARFLQGNPGDWSFHADIQDVDGLLVYMTREKLASLVVETGLYPFLVLNPPEPTCFFSFTRARTRLYTMTMEPDYALSSDPSREEWLFTVFGYLTDTTRVFMTVLPTHIEMHCEPRNMPFTLAS